MNKIFLATTAAIALVACNNGNQQQQQSKEPEAYPVIVVGEQNTVSYLSYPVNIEGVVNSDVQAKISGYITKVLVDEGQVVTHNRLLSGLSPFGGSGATTQDCLTPLTLHFSSIKSAFLSILFA